MTMILSVILPFLCAFGLQIIFLGIRGRRVGDMRVCPKCDYIIADEENATRCTECGLALDKDSVVRGKRRGRPGLIVVGVLMMVVGAAAVIGPLTGGGTNRHLPTKVLIWIGSEGPFGTITELSRRVTAGTLTKENHRELADRALESQREGAETWFRSNDWVDLLEVMDVAGVLTANERKTYYEQCVRNIEIDVSKRLMRSEYLEFHATFNTCMARMGIDASVENEQLIVDGRTIESRDIDTYCLPEGGVYQGQGRVTLESSLPPGEHHATFNAEIFLSRNGVVLLKWPLHKEIEFIVEDHDWSRLAEESASTDKSFRDAFEPVPIDLPNATGQSKGRIDVRFHVSDKLPASAAFDLVVVMPNGEEQVLDVICGRKGDDRFRRTWRPGSGTIPLQYVEIILRPNLEEARRRGYAEIYPKEVRLGKMKIGKIP